MQRDLLSFYKKTVHQSALLFLVFVFLPYLGFSQLNLTVASNPVTCFGQCNGSATVSVTGGTTPYTYQWNTGASTSTATGLCGTVAGFPYDITVTDATGQTAVQWATIFSPPQLTATVSGSSQICGVAPDGTASITPSGGVPPYTYSWNNGQTSPQITGLAAGTYFATVTDANGCTAAGSYTVDLFDEGIWLMDSTVNVTCFGLNNGFTYIGVMSGTPPYTYSWANGASGPSLSNLAPGTYNVTVSDANGCSNQWTVLITQPAPITLNVSSTNALCGNTGTANVSATGGTAPISFLWSNGSSNPNLVNLAPGTYTVTATDAKGCKNTSSVTIQGTGGNLNINTTVNSNATCLSGGSATATVFGGSGNYSYMWANGQNTATATNLLVGTYNVTVVDVSNGCSGVGTVSIGQTAAPTVSISVTTQPSCTNTGSATAVANGTGSFTYAWSNGQSGPNASNLSAGVLTVTVTDAGGCIGTASITLTAPAGPSASITVLSNATCAIGGSATVNVSGGNAPYTYLWDNTQTTATASNLAAGTHRVTVTDASGCSTTATTSISTSSNGTTVSTSVNSNATCLTGGSATATASGGVAPYTYAWTNGQSGATLTNLPANTYSVTATDAQGCSAIGMVTISQAPNPTVSVVANSPATCLTGGSATATASGGTAPYTYLWGGGQTTATPTNLPAGSASVTVTDAAGCTASGSVTIAAPAMLSVSITSSANATCDQAGTATAMAFGGTGNKTYLWSNGEATATAANLPVGPHRVTVTDAAGCTATTTVTIGLTKNGINVGNYVWYDNDQDGFQDPTDTFGVANVTVRLFKLGPDGIPYTADDVVIATRSTDANGAYLFDCVTPGQYYIEFSGIPANHQFTKKDNVNNDCKDSDADLQGKTAVFTVVAGQSDNLCLDAGVHENCANVTNAGFIGNNQTICEGETPDPLISIQLPSGGTGAIEYVWLQLVQGPGALWVGVPTTTNTPTLTLGPLTVTTHFMRCARRVGCNTFVESNIVTITVLPNGSSGCTQFLKGMTVSATAKKSVLVKWTTTAELADYAYILEKSQDGVTYAQIATVLGKKDRINDNTYQYYDHTPYNGMNFYRLRRLDAANFSVMTNAVSLNVEFALTETVVAKPNPVVDNLRLNNLATYEEDVLVQVISMNGNVVHSLIIPANTYLDTEIPMGDKAAGVYALRVRFGQKGGSTVTKIVKY